jgi:hypothetical protein
MTVEQETVSRQVTGCQSQKSLLIIFEIPAGH